jgi:hypothetical protein
MEHGLAYTAHLSHRRMDGYFYGAEVDRSRNNLPIWPAPAPHYHQPAASSQPQTHIPQPLSYSTTPSVSYSVQFGATLLPQLEPPRQQIRPIIRDPASAPLRKLSVDLIKTYKRINEVCVCIFGILFVRIAVISCT